MTTYCTRIGDIRIETKNLNKLTKTVYNLLKSEYNEISITRTRKVENGYN